MGDTLSPAGWYGASAVTPATLCWGSCLQRQVGSRDAWHNSQANRLPGQGLRSLMVGVGTRASACTYLLCAQAARAARASAHRSVEFHKSWGRNQNQRVNGFWASREVH